MVAEPSATCAFIVRLLQLLCWLACLLFIPRISDYLDFLSPAL